MNDLLKTVLLSNSSQIGYNWIYNSEFLNKRSLEENMLMTKPNNDDYHYNKPSYNSYEGKPAGTNSIQGEILKWLYNGFLKHENFDENDYKRLLLEKFMPGGSYSGYVESYGKKLVLKELNKILKIEDNLIMDDDQLVGFIPYIICKVFNKSNEEAIKLTEVLTNNNDYLLFFKAFDEITKNKHLNKKELLTKIIKGLNVTYQSSLLKAVNSNNSSDFINGPHDLSCSIDVALPIIFYLYNKHLKLYDALEENVKLGGASSDRALLLGLLYYPDELPKEWDKYFNL